ncbi:MAG: hypothetical protein J7L71_09950, partial [Spirochaetaceae bacterium]|nr:hypothetical protein [Spirochaetaceae bacterium]
PRDPKMEKVFIADPLKIRTMDKNIKERLDNIIRNKIEVLVNIAMAKDTDFGFMIWNGKSNGTLNNTLNLLEQGKKTRLYLKPVQKFYSIIKLKDFEGLLNNCDSEDLKKIDKKIKLYERINVLSQGNLFNVQNEFYNKTKEDNLLLALEEGQYEVGGE